MPSENGGRVSSDLVFLDAPNVLHGIINSLTSSTNVHVAHYTEAAGIVVELCGYLCISSEKSDFYQKLEPFLTMKLRMCVFVRVCKCVSVHDSDI